MGWRRTTLRSIVSRKGGGWLSRGKHRACCSRREAEVNIVIAEVTSRRMGSSTGLGAGVFGGGFQPHLKIGRRGGGESGRFEELVGIGPQHNGVLLPR